MLADRQRSHHLLRIRIDNSQDAILAADEQPSVARVQRHAGWFLATRNRRGLRDLAPLDVHGDERILVLEIHPERAFAVGR